MMTLVLWLLAVASLFVGTGAITLALIPAFPTTWTWHHYTLRRPVAVVLLVGSVALAAWAIPSGLLGVPGAAGPLAVTLLGAVLAFRLHQEYAFPAIDFPAEAEDPLALPLRVDHEVALVEVDGVSRAWPLDFVIHHHVVNDRFGDRLVALTYCAMCRTVIAFDVTEIGPLFVGSFRDANMIVADRRTKTFFQQATFESVIGPLHPRSLEMIPCQIMAWGDVRRLEPMPAVAAVTERDLRAFELPVPGAWKRIMASDKTPGLLAARRDTSRGARTRVVGVIDPAVPARAWLKSSLLERRLTRSPDGTMYVAAVRDGVVAFRGALEGRMLELELDESGRELREASTGRTWDLRGHPRGEHPGLVPVAISDEYWFSWRFWHPRVEVEVEVG